MSFTLRLGNQSEFSELVLNFPIAAITYKILFKTKIKLKLRYNFILFDV